ncbi:MAG: GAF domain-containing protein, partial [Gammaproteobacteria bacterium]|nr:GAF domain-containing protein [Gammaproteobacteria bacterium]
ISELNRIGIALSAEKDSRSLLKHILIGAKSLTNADGGSLYSITDDQQLKFEIVTTDSLNISLGDREGHSVKFPPLPLYINGQPNTSMVVTSAVLDDKVINIHDVYDVEGYDFSGTREFDKSTGYLTRSILTIPMKNHEDKIIGVLQLINAIDKESGQVIAFSEEDAQLAESLASQAAVTLTTKKLIDQQKELFESFIQLIATSIDEKSPYTGGHCKRVPELTMMIAEACNAKLSGPLKDFKLTGKDRYELRIAGWLHDCGKVTTPEYVIDKATKLETIYDRINTVDTRFEVLKRDAKIEMLEQKISHLAENSTIDNSGIEKAFEEKIKKLNDDRDFIRTSNVGGEFMDDELQQRVRDIAKYRWLDPHNAESNLLDDDEVKNMIIQRGTLNDEEREIINNHIVMTIKMLGELPFPKHLLN